MKKPTFFISSTIYDFLDLRSAIKFYLEEQGCEVLASEYNDFRKPLDVHSYQACFESLKNADYFILLIGRRVGGWYDEKKRISITRMEYQEAYKLHCAGKLKILNFVRRDIWNLRSDRNELAKLLEEQEFLDNEKKSLLVNYPTKSANNPEFILEFLNEIGRNSETKKALKDEGDFPSGNWIHPFSSFRDIVDVLRPELFNGEPLSDAVIKTLLLSELKEILSMSLVKFKDSIYSPTTTIIMFYQKHELNCETRHNKYIDVETKRWDLLSTLALNLMKVKYNPSIIPYVLRNSTFLEFESKSGILKENQIYRALKYLNNEIQLFRENFKDDTLEIVFRNSPNTRRGQHSEYVHLETFEFVALLSVMQRWSNIIEMTTALIKHLNGQDFIWPKLFGRSPILGMDEEYQEEDLTEEELIKYLNGAK